MNALNGMTITKLRIVELLAKHRNITAVADILELKQPTITFHMKNMERDFGVKLFEARMGRVMLTDAGKLFKRKIYMATHKHRYASALLSRFRDELLHG